MRRRGGFTIIEASLVMAVTGLIAVTLIVGWVTNVNTQSYKDGVNSLTAKLQTKYDDVYNTSNERSRQLTCTPGTPPTISYNDTATTSNQGSSDCVVMGQYILFSDTTVLSRRIMGVDNASASTTNDLQAIKDYQPQTVPESIEQGDNYEMPWGITLYKANDPAKSPLYRAIAIVRSPLSGSVYTYGLDTVSGTEPSVLSVLGGDTNKTTLCLLPGASVSSTPMAVTIAKDASTHESVGTQSQEASNGCR